MACQNWRGSSQFRSLYKLLFSYLFLITILLSLMLISMVSLNGVPFVGIDQPFFLLQMNGDIAVARPLSDWSDCQESGKVS